MSSSESSSIFAPLHITPRAIFPEDTVVVMPIPLAA
jgi:hypothetical protein